MRGAGEDTPPTLGLCPTGSRDSPPHPCSGSDADGRLLPWPTLRLAETTVVYPADVVLFEGILVFYSQEIRDMFHLRLFVDTDSDVRLSRRGKADAGPSAPGQPGPRPPGICRPLLSPVTAVLRDVQRGRDLEQILTQYTTFVKPAFEEFCLPVPPSACPGTSFPPLSEGPLVPVL